MYVFDKLILSYFTFSMFYLFEFFFYFFYLFIFFFQFFFFYLFTFFFFIVALGSILFHFFKTNVTLKSLFSITIQTSQARPTDMNDMWRLIIHCFKLNLDLEDDLSICRQMI